MAARLTKEQFIKRYNEVYQPKYDEFQRNLKSIHNVAVSMWCTGGEVDMVDAEHAYDICYDEFGDKFDHLSFRADFNFDIEAENAMYKDEALTKKFFGEIREFINEKRKTNHTFEDAEIEDEWMQVRLYGDTKYGSFYKDWYTFAKFLDKRVAEIIKNSKKD